MVVENELPAPLPGKEKAPVQVAARLRVGPLTKTIEPAPIELLVKLTGMLTVPSSGIAPVPSIRVPRTPPVYVPLKPDKGCKSVGLPASHME